MNTLHKRTTGTINERVHHGDATNVLRVFQECCIAHKMMHNATPARPLPAYAGGCCMQYWWNTPQNTSHEVFDIISNTAPWNTQGTLFLRDFASIWHGPQQRLREVRQARGAERGGKRGGV